MLADKFSHIKKFSGGKGNRIVARILPGEYYVTRQDEVISTVLGSCISACVHDPVLRIGGMNHFMLPSSHSSEEGWNRTAANAANRYGNFAMESLVNDILSMGGAKHRLQVKIFGGGKILKTMTDIGERNISFIESYLAAENIQPLTYDLGNRYPRKVSYYPTTGKAWVKKLRSLYCEKIISREQHFAEEIESEKVSGEIELF